LHRDLHCKNILVDPNLTHATLIDFDLMCFHGSVVGLEADMELQQVWPLQFSAWESKLCASMDSQQLATLLVQVYMWDLMRPVDLKKMHALFVFDVNCCTGCGCASSLGPWCPQCEPFIDYFRILYTWPLHLQRPHARSPVLMEKMLQFLEARRAGPRVQAVFRTACEKACIVPAIMEGVFLRRYWDGEMDGGADWFGAGDTKTGEFWFNVIESLSKYPPPMVHDVFPQMRRCFKPAVVRNGLDLDLGELQHKAKIILTFYLHKLDDLAVRYPMTYLSEFCWFACPVCVCGDRWTRRRNVL